MQTAPDLLASALCPLIPDVCWWALQVRVVSLALVALLSSWCGVEGRNPVLSAPEARGRLSSLRAEGRQVSQSRTGEDCDLHAPQFPQGGGQGPDGRAEGGRHPASRSGRHHGDLDTRVCPVHACLPACRVCSRVWLADCARGTCVECQLYVCLPVALASLAPRGVTWFSLGRASCHVSVGVANVHVCEWVRAFHMRVSGC